MNDEREVFFLMEGCCYSQRRRGLKTFSFVINDWTDDFDTPEEYEEWFKARGLVK